MGSELSGSGLGIAKGKQSCVNLCSRVFRHWGLWCLMVQLAGYGKLQQESELPVKWPLAADGSCPVKLEIEDQLEDEYGSLTKRSKVNLKICFLLYSR